MEECRYLRPYRSSFCGFIVQDAETVFVWFAVGGRSREDVGSLYPLPKKRGITREIDMGMDIDEQATGHVVADGGAED